MSEFVTLEDLDALEKRIKAIEEASEAYDVAKLASQVAINTHYIPKIRELETKLSAYEKYHPLIDALKEYFTGDADITLIKKITSLNVVESRETIQVDASTVRGQILLLAVDGKLNDVRLGGVMKLLKERGRTPRRTTISKELLALVKLGPIIRKLEEGEYLYSIAEDFHSIVQRTEAS